MSQIRIDHFSDVLCIWAYAAQIRMEQLSEVFADKVDIKYHFFPVFGDVQAKMEKSWAHRGGVDAYRQHVLAVAEKFDHIDINPEVWVQNTPASSLPAHLYLAAIRLAEEKHVLSSDARLSYLNAVRTAFFVQGRDVAQMPVLHALAEEVQLPRAPIEVELASGSAFARLSANMQLAAEQQVTASPTVIFNEGRQRLAGNVGYRIIEANLRELMEHPAGQASWC